MIEDTAYGVLKERLRIKYEAFDFFTKIDVYQF